MKSVLITGDIVLDCHIYEGRRKHYGEISPGVRIVSAKGGAALVHDLLEELLKKDPAEWESHLAVDLAQTESDDSSVDTSHHAYAFWRPFPRKAPEEKQSWRVSEALGFGSARSESGCASLSPAKGMPSDPEIIVLSDGGMGFRDDDECWKDLNFEQAQWIVLKTASPLFEGELWKRLSKQHADRLVVVVSARELRKSTARISSGLSWEETIENLICDLDGSLEPLKQCRHLLVAFESESGVWFDFGDAGNDVHFVYDASSIEGDHARNVEGTAFGFLSCLTAAAAWELTFDKPDLQAALEGGLSAMRDLREKGHGPAGLKPEGFPIKRLVEVIKVPTHCYSIATFSREGPVRARTSGSDWSLLRESQGQESPPHDLARLVVLYGPIALANLPQLRIGRLLTVDRQEIQSLRTLSQIVRRYRDRDPGKKPLSLGVFGPPGAGKSFAVEELAKDLDGGKGWMEFNLSQFNTADDLIGAFHQIRDRVLKGLLPVAFFDEFDSQRYRWLQYLLAPMQDGKFQEGQLTHPLGKCIFIFAGGTSWTFETLGPPEPADGKDETEEYGKFRLAKGPDFKSRLDGYLNVIGPNRRKVLRPDGSEEDEGIQYASKHRFVDDPQDDHFPIRRALMIRAGLGCTPDQKLEIDEGVLHALLTVTTFVHGARSLNKVLQPLKAALPGPIHRSYIAPRGQLDMHIKDGNEFFRLLGESSQRARPTSMSDPEIELMAPAIHETWKQLGLKVGWVTKKTAEDFEDLDGFTENSNRAAAKGMPCILDLIGLGLEPGGADEQELHAIRQHIEYHLELLAEAEHDRWMSWHHDQGWRLGPGKKDPDKKTHPALIPYRKLREEEKNKDRIQIRSYPDFAARAGKKIVFSEVRSVVGAAIPPESGRTQ